MGVSAPVFLRNMYVECTGEMNKLSDREKAIVSDDLQYFLNKQSRFTEARLRINIKQHKEKFRDLPSMYVLINLRTNKGNFNSSASGWGAEKAVHSALEKLNLQIEKKFDKYEKHETIVKLFSKQAIV